VRPVGLRALPTGRTAVRPYTALNFTGFSTG
jgi:hypothetical protein